MDISLDVKQEFCNFYPKLLTQLKTSSSFEELPMMQKWIEQA